MHCSRASLASTSLLLCTRIEHAFIVIEAVLAALPRDLKLLYVGVKLINLAATCCKRLSALPLHFFECLRVLLEQIHLKQVVLLKFLKVLPKGALVNRHGVPIVGVICIEVYIGDVEFIVSLIPFNIDSLDLAL